MENHVREEKTEIRLPEGAERILLKLQKAGYEAFIVGGCVRDALLHRSPEDWDITTSALPGELKALFPRTIDTGIQHGTVTVLQRETEGGVIRDSAYEVTSYRIDGEYPDGRHPKEVRFTPSLSEDLARRDFTINAMAYHPAQGLVDCYDGRGDLARGILRAVGDPEKRFMEDALRMLRALRFSAQLDFRIEPRSYAAILKLRERLSLVSRERVQLELSKLLLSEHPERIEEVFTTGLARYVAEDFPALEAQGNLFSEGFGPLPPEYREKYAAYGILCLRKSPEFCRKLLRELKLDNGTTERAGKLVELMRQPLPRTETETRKLLSRFGAPLLRLSLGIRARELSLSWEKSAFACSFARSVDEPSPKQEKDTGKAAPLGEAERSLAQQRLRRRLKEIHEETDRILSRGDCLTKRELALTGKDLKALGVPEGPGMGKLLEALLILVLEQPEKNSREALKTELRRLLPTFSRGG